MLAHYYKITNTFITNSNTSYVALNGIEYNYKYHQQQSPVFAFKYNNDLIVMHVADTVERLQFDLLFDLDLFYGEDAGLTFPQDRFKNFFVRNEASVCVQQSSLTNVFEYIVAAVYENVHYNGRDPNYNNETISEYNAKKYFVKDNNFVMLNSIDSMDKLLQVFPLSSTGSKQKYLDNSNIFNTNITSFMSALDLLIFDETILLPIQNNLTYDNNIW